MGTVVMYGMGYPLEPIIVHCNPLEPIVVHCTPLYSIVLQHGMHVYLNVNTSFPKRIPVKKISENAGESSSVRTSYKLISVHGHFFPAQLFT